MYRLFYFGLGLMLLSWNSTGFGWELQTGSSKEQQTFWQRGSIIQGRQLTAVTDETRQWNRFRLNFGPQSWSIAQETLTNEVFNQSRTLLSRHKVDRITPKFSFKAGNAELSVGRTFEQVALIEGSYQPTLATRKDNIQSFFKVKVEKNREYISIKGAQERDLFLAPSSQLEQHYYRTRTVEVGAYNRRLKGWKIGFTRRERVHPDASGDQVNRLGSFQYHDDQPAKPRVGGYWKYLHLDLQNFVIGPTMGVELVIKSGFSFIFWNAQHLFEYRFRGRNLKKTYDITLLGSPSRSLVGSVQLVNQLSYRGETQLFSSPLILNWAYQYRETPILADYRTDLLTLGLKFNY